MTRQESSSDEDAELRDTPVDFFNLLSRNYNNLNNLQPISE